MHPEQPATSNQQLLLGIRLFNEARFFEAHEAWEERWLRAEGEERLFLQGLIQLAAAYHHLQRGTTRGAERLLDAATAKLLRVPADFLGVDCANLLALVGEDRLRPRQANEDAEKFPKIRYN